MSGVFYIFAAIIALFFVLLLAKGLIARKARLCLVCASVSLTWITLLILYKRGYFDDVVILGMLMGQSIVGIFYLLEGKLDEKFHLFKVPFLLTLTLVFYSLVSFPEDFTGVAMLLGALWAALLLMFFFRKSKWVGGFVKKILECCRRW